MLRERTGSRRRTRGEGGFTLVEVLAALMVLLVGITTLLGVMASGLSTQRRADMRQRASELVGLVEQDLLDRPFAGGGTGGVQDLQDVPVPGHAGMRYSVEFTRHPDMPDEYLARIRISWLEGGDFRGETFHRIVHRGEPFSRRILNRRQ